jgi:hypothetical protein
MWYFVYRIAAGADACWRGRTLLKKKRINSRYNYKDTRLKAQDPRLKIKGNFTAGAAN